MIYGIDLGTTNSLIGRGSWLATGLVSSAVDLDTGEQVDRDTFEGNVYHSYKTNMTLGESGKNPIMCSSIILKKLAEVCSRRCGEKVEDVVISVPAYFSVTQREAVYQAANLAKLNVKCLINEPTAAAIYTCSERSELIAVYDLGGGTFDVSIVDNRSGICSVIATDGLVLGGDDLDNALVELVMSEVRLPTRYRTDANLKRLKIQMRVTKEKIQKQQESILVDLGIIGYDATFTLTVNKYKEIVCRVFGRTVSMLKHLIAEYVPTYEKVSIVFVGGSSYDPFVKEMVMSSVDCREVISDCSPDYIVARGVALYAEMLEDGRAAMYIEDVTKQLCIADSEGNSLPIIDENTLVPCRGVIQVRNRDKSKTLTLELYQGNSAKIQNNEYIGTLIYQFGRMVNAHEGVVDVTVDVTPDGLITLEACETMAFMEPQKIELVYRR